LLKRLLDYHTEQSALFGVRANVLVGNRGRVYLTTHHDSCVFDIVPRSAPFPDQRANGSAAVRPDTPHQALHLARTQGAGALEPGVKGLYGLRLFRVRERYHSAIQHTRLASRAPDQHSRGPARLYAKTD